MGDVFLQNMEEIETLKWLESNLFKISNGFDREFIDKILELYEKDVDFREKELIQKEIKSVEWLKENLSEIIKQLKSKALESFYIKYNKIAENFHNLVNPIDDNTNVFAAYSDTRSELRHTMTFSYFLQRNPELLKCFLTRFVDTDFGNIEPTIEPEYSFFYDVEKRIVRFDILIMWQTKGGVKHSLIVEAKIDANENEYITSSGKIGQLKLYEEILNKNQKQFGANVSVVFLTKEDAEIENGFENILWLDILAMCQKYIFIKRNEMTADLYFMQLWIGSFLGYVYECPTQSEMQKDTYVDSIAIETLTNFIEKLA